MELRRLAPPRSSRGFTSGFYIGRRTRSSHVTAVTCVS
jgi:hypothetical protein